MKGGQEKTGAFRHDPTGVSRFRRIGNSSFFDSIPAFFLKNAEKSKISDAVNQEMTAGELPSATMVGENIVTSYLKKEDGKRGIWLAVTNRR